MKTKTFLVALGASILFHGCQSAKPAPPTIHLAGRVDSTLIPNFPAAMAWIESPTGVDSVKYSFGSTFKRAGTDTFPLFEQGTILAISYKQGIASDTARQKVVLDGGFEDSTGPGRLGPDVSIPSNWRCHPAGGWSGNRDSGLVLSGRGSLRMHWQTGCKGEADPSGSVVFRPAVPVPVTRNLRLYGKVRFAGPGVPSMMGNFALKFRPSFKLKSPSGIWTVDSMFQGQTNPLFFVRDIGTFSFALAPQDTSYTTIGASASILAAELQISCSPPLASFQGSMLIDDLVIR